MSDTKKHKDFTNLREHYTRVFKPKNATLMKVVMCLEPIEYGNDINLN